MKKSEHIIGLINECITNEQMDKAITKFLEEDFVPENSTGLICMENLRNRIKEILPATCGMRCTRVIGNDIQSGPLYCGYPAQVYVVLKNTNDLISMCEDCAKRLL